MKEPDRIRHLQKFSAVTLSASNRGSSADSNESTQNLVSDEPSCSYEPTREPNYCSSGSSSEDEPSDPKKVKRQLVFPSPVDEFRESVAVPTMVLEAFGRKLVLC